MARRRWAAPPPDTPPSARPPVFSRYTIDVPPSRTANGQLVPRHPRSVTAAAQLLQAGRKPATPDADPPRVAAGSVKTWRAAARVWQDEAWGLYDQTPELRFLLNWKSVLASQVHLVAARPSDTGEPEIITEGPDFNLVSTLLGGRPGQAELLRRAVMHLGLVGESYLVGRADQDPDLIAYSPAEISGGTDAGDRWRVDDGSGQVPLSADVPIVRAWVPHPRFRQWPDSPVHSLLPVLRELRGLTMHVSAQIDSRLAGAGVWFLPQSLAYTSSSTRETPDDGDPFFLDLMDVMQTAVANRASAAALVPLVVRVPDEVYDRIRPDTLIRFDTPLDDKAQALRDEAIRRISLGMDTPPEILIGLSGTNHWSAWQIDEAAVRIAIAPDVTVVCHALTHMLRGLLSNGSVVWFDTTPLTLRADRTDDAFALYDRKQLSGDTLRRVTGFTDDDEPDAAELAARADPTAATASRPGRPIPGDV